MNQSSQKVLGYLTNNQNFDEVPVEELEKLVAEHPFFPVGHFLLAKKLQANNKERFSTQVQKTILYFSNPYWLDYMLTQQNRQVPVENSTENKADEKLPVTAVVTETGVEPETATASAFITDTTETEAGNKEFAAVETTQSSETVLDEEDLPAAAQVEVVALEEEMAGVTHTQEVTTEHFLEEVELADEKNDEPISDEHDKMFENIKAMLDASTEEADADTKNAVIPIDPYYTIDYFASQGIKLELEPNPQDQLGQHLKKFTHWLKHMKKLGPEDATEVISRTETDADIQQIADSSNTAREVVTEAMALVLEKQGKKDKAIELYNKLSFLNPHKNAYFADKIKNLKGF